MNQFVNLKHSHYTCMIFNLLAYKMITKIFENVTYDTDVNACYITIKSDLQIVDTIESEPDCWVDIAADGSVVGIEVLNANQHYTLINSILLSHKPLEECVSY